MPTQRDTVLSNIVFKRTRLVSGFHIQIGKAEDNNCIYCGKMDDAKHTILECERRLQGRNILEIDIGISLAEENIIKNMIKRQEVWKKVHYFILRSVMKEKEEEERAHQRR